MAVAGRASTSSVDPGSIIPTVVALTARSASASAAATRDDPGPQPRVSRWPISASAATMASADAASGSLSYRRAPAVKARVDHRVRRAAGPSHDHRGVRSERPIARSTPARTPAHPS